MKWLIVAACLNCADPSPMPIAVLSDVDREACRELAAMALVYAQRELPTDVIAGAWCVSLDDWQDDVDDYPQRR